MSEKRTYMWKRGTHQLPLVDWKEGNQAQKSFDEGEACCGGLVAHSAPHPSEI